MIPRLFALRDLASLGIAAAVCFAFAPHATAQNTTDLSGFVGRYVGKAEVSVAPQATYRGKSKKVKISLKTVPTAAKVEIKAFVRVGARSVAINNVLTFAASGEFRGRELAPGVTSGSRMKGHYTATSNSISFNGKFREGTAKGTYSGSISEDTTTGIITIRYEILVGENPLPSFIYTYTVKPPKPRT